ncbi:MAG: hypothetical protein LUC37_06675, partial [Prevotella sp.]|nr:hypothetical protein [Prevotella sp.]
METFREICAGLFAGAFIALGCCGYVMTGNYVVGAALFAVALLMIKQYDLCLFTGKVGRIHTVDEGIHCFIILLLN